MASRLKCPKCPRGNLWFDVCWFCGWNMKVEAYTFAGLRPQDRLEDS